MRTANWVEPCLLSVQTAARRYTQSIERTEANNIEFELTRLHNRSLAGGPAPEPATEEAIRERIRRLAESRQEWRAILDICNEIPAPKTQESGKGSKGIEIAPAEQTTPAVSNGGSGQSSLPTAVPRRSVTYLSGPLPSGQILAIEPSTDAFVTMELNRVLKTEVGSFTYAFFADGAFGRLLGGDASILGTLSLTPNTVLFACRSSISTGNGEVSSDLRRADVRLTCRRFDARTGTHQIIDATGTGTGFNDQQAQRMGIERTAKALGKQLPKL